VTDSIEAQRILMWARDNRFLLTRVKVGAVEVDVAADLSLIPDRPPSIVDDRPSANPYETHGAAGLARLHRDEAKVGGGEASNTVEDED
jgi:hypothetical protein